jgi:uncharacterized protein YjiS (DUF1127 family)
METLRLHWSSTRLSAGPLARVLARALDRLWEWRARSRERRHLATFNDAMLKDIGVSRGDAMTECDKPFWRA